MVAESIHAGKFVECTPTAENKDTCIANPANNDFLSGCVERAAERERSGKQVGFGSITSYADMYDEAVCGFAQTAVDSFGSSDAASSTPSTQEYDE